VRTTARPCGGPFYVYSTIGRFPAQYVAPGFKVVDY